jgi:hypothetical protein
MAPFLSKPFILLYWQNSKWFVHEEAISILANLSTGKPLRVIAVAGPLRSGKSFIMNRLAGKSDGFEIGPSVVGCTRGIWGWMAQEDLLLIDTEGMYDPDRQDKQLDLQLFVAAVLLSSLLVYNTKGVIDEKAIEQLNFVSQLSKKIIVSKSITRVNDVYDKMKDIFPKLVWLLRDFHFDLSDYDHDSDKYLMNSLRDIEDRTDPLNIVRRAILDFFPTHHCLTMSSPLLDSEMLQRIDQIPFDRLDGTFQMTCNAAMDRILKLVPPKRILNPTLSVNDPTSFIHITPKTFLDYAQNIVDAFNTNGIPNVEDLWTAASRRACDGAYEAGMMAFDKYVSTMFDSSGFADDTVVHDIRFSFGRCRLPVVDEANFDTQLSCATREAYEVFVPLALGPLLQEAKDKMDAYLRDATSRARLVNYDRSKKCCTLAIDAIIKKMSSNQVYTSFDEFAKSMAEMLSSYEVVTKGKGEAHLDVLADHVQRIDDLREIQRKHFEVDQAQRDRDAAERRLFDEMQAADVKHRELAAEVNRAREEAERQILLFERESATLRCRLASMESDFELRDKIHEETILHLRETNQKDLERMEVDLRRQNNEQVSRLRGEYEARERLMKQESTRQSDAVNALEAQIQNLKAEHERNLHEIHNAAIANHPNSDASGNSRGESFFFDVMGAVVCKFLFF